MKFVSDERRVPVALAIAGSDSGGGAGIQADLKAFARCGVHGATAVTALTAQNTVGVEAVMPVDPEMIVAQVRAVPSDLGVDAVKVGMLADEATIDAVVEALRLADGAPVVVDPVMVAESGAPLLDPAARAALIERVLPLATVTTPNVLEARALSGLGEAAGQEELGRAILALGPEAVVVTGGHTDSGADVLVDDAGAVRIEGPRYPGGASARLGLHALVGTGGLPRARHRAGRGGALGARDRRRGRGQRAAGHRGRRGAGRRLRARPALTACEPLT